MIVLDRRRVMGIGNNLPYDSRVAYLGTTGTQYIDTNVTLSRSAEFHIKFMLTSDTATAPLFGSRMTTSSNAYALQVTHSQLRFGFANSTSSLSITFEDNTWYTVDFVAGKLYLDGVQIESRNTSTSTTPPYRAHLFCIRASSQYYLGSGYRISEFSLYRNGTTLIDLVPVRIGSVGYMYDKVSGTLYGNDGTGSFTYGSDII